MEFNPLFSTRECYRNDDQTKCLEDDVLKLESMKIVGDDGGCEYSATKAKSSDCLAMIESMPMGVHTMYSQSGVTNNPKTFEAWRFLIHKNGSIITWVLAFGSQGSVYNNYRNENGWTGWCCLRDGNPSALWSGKYYMTANQVVTPAKSLSQCQTGWILLWSDYEPSTSTAQDADFVASYIPKKKPDGSNWDGKSFLIDVARFAGSASSSEDRIIKRIYVHDSKLVGHADNNQPNRNDVVLRAVYEF